MVTQSKKRLCYARAVVLVLRMPILIRTGVDASSGSSWRGLVKLLCLHLRPLGCAMLAYRCERKEQSVFPFVRTLSVFDFGPGPGLVSCLFHLIFQKLVYCWHRDACWPPLPLQLAGGEFARVTGIAASCRVPAWLSHGCWWSASLAQACSRPDSSNGRWQIVCIVTSK
jgi:hypothetical protein